MQPTATEPKSWTTGDLLEAAAQARLAYVLLAAVAAVALGVLVLTVRLKVVAVVAVIGGASLLALVRPDLGLLTLIVFDAAELSRAASASSPFTAVRIFGALTLLSWLARGGSPGVGRRLQSPQLTFLLGYFLVAALSIFYAPHPELSMPIIREYFMIFLLFLLLVALARSEWHLQAISWTLVGAAVISIGLAMRQYEPHMERLASSQSNPNYFALHLVAVLPLAFYLAVAERRALVRVGMLGLALLIMGAIAKTYSRGAFLGMALVVVVLIVHLLRYPRRSMRRLVVPVLGVLVVGVVLLPAGYMDRVRSIASSPGTQDLSIYRRRQTNWATWQMFLDHPLLGVGLGNSTPLSVVYRPQIGIERAPHNIVLEVASETGVLGLLCFALAVGCAGVDFARAAGHYRRRANWLMYALCSAYLVGLGGFMVTALFKTATVVRVLWTMVAISVVARNLVAQELRAGEPEAP